VQTARATITALSPYGETVAVQGSTMTATWATDPTGQWTDMNITLMTGWNTNMSPLRGETLELITPPRWWVV